MEQLKLLLRDQKKQVSTDVIEKLPNFTSALKMCLEISGLDGKQVAPVIGTDEGNLNKVWQKKNGELGNGNRYFPENKILEFMHTCENIVPLIWLALKCGYTLEPRKTELELQLEERDKEIAQLKNELEVLAKYKKAGLI